MKYPIAAMILLICLAARGGNDRVKIGINAPAFSIQDQDGRNVTLAEFIGKTVVLEWFDPDCDYTKRDVAAKSSKTIAEKYKDKGVVWLAIHSTRLSNRGYNKAWIEKNELPFPVLEDSSKTVAAKFGVDSVPYFVIVDKHGTVAYLGALDDDDSRKGEKKEGKRNYIDRALEEITLGKGITIPETRLYGCPLP